MSEIDTESTIRYLTEGERILAKQVRSAHDREIDAVMRAEVAEVALSIQQMWVKHYKGEWELACAVAADLDRKADRVRELCDRQSLEPKIELARDVLNTLDGNDSGNWGASGSGSSGSKITDGGYR